MSATCIFFNTVGLLYGGVKGRSNEMRKFLEKSPGLTYNVWRRLTQVFTMSPGGWAINGAV